jgi:hypothetical protein
MYEKYDLNEQYINSIKKVISLSKSDFVRLSVFRFDLRFPSCDAEAPAFFIDVDDRIISRFFRSLIAKLDAKDNRSLRQGERVYRNKLRYVWVKENSENHGWHYHVAIFMNKDAHAFLGDFRKLDNLSGLIRGAWLSALGSEFDGLISTVHFPQNPVYYLDQNQSKVQQCDAEDSLMRRLSYLAKNRSKSYSKKSRSIGFSTR